MSTTCLIKPLGIILIPGGFHLPSCFDKPKQQLEASGFSPVLTVRHPSIGHDRADVSVNDDARNIQTTLQPYVDQGVEFIAISHSYGGTPLTIATEGFSVEERAARGEKGGIRAVVYLTSNMPPKKGGSALSVLPPGLDIVDIKEDGLLVANSKAKAAFYGPDMDDAEADALMACLLPQSSMAMFGDVSYALEDLKVPAYYIVCEKDQTISVATQEAIASTIPTLRRVLRIPGGHSAFLTQICRFVEQILDIAKDSRDEALAT